MNISISLEDILDHMEMNYDIMEFDVSLKTLEFTDVMEMTTQDELDRILRMGLADEEEVMKEPVERKVDKMDMDMDGWQHGLDNFDFSDWLDEELCDMKTVHTLYN